MNMKTPWRMPAIRRCALHFLSHSERVRGVHYGTAPFQTASELAFERKQSGIGMRTKN